MSNHAISEPQESNEKQQRASRVSLLLEVAGSTDREHVPVTVHNMSETGILIETQSVLAVGQKITIELPQADAVSALVVWQSAPLFGCRFDQPLSRAALSAAQLRNPVPAEFNAAAPVRAVSQPQIQESLGQRLLRLRRSKGISRAALSMRTGLSKPSIWAWETGRAAPRRDSLERLAEAFGISEAELRWGMIPAREERLNGERMHDEAPKAEGGLLGDVIEAAKADIAASAGVDKKNVKILIEY
jgi:transcriptional regulator with XRE-family HTH domain